MQIKGEQLQLGSNFFEFLKASIARLITLLSSSVQNSEKLLNLLYEGGEVPAAVITAHVGHK